MSFAFNRQNARRSSNSKSHLLQETPVAANDISKSSSLGMPGALPYLPTRTPMAQSSAKIDLSRVSQSVNTAELYPAEVDDPTPRIKESLVSLVEAGQHVQAATYGKKLLATHRDSPFLWWLLGRCHRVAQRHDDALTCLNKSRNLAPLWPAAIVEMADVYKAENNPDKAIALYEQALEGEATNISALNNLSSALIDVGEYDRAVAHLRLALEIAPEHAPLHFNYANALRRGGDSNGALTQYARALDLDPQLTVAQKNFAQLLKQEGNSEAALSHFTKLLANNPHDDKTRASVLHLKAQLADWSWVSEYEACRRSLGMHGTPVSPFATMGLEDNPDLLRLRTQAYSSQFFPAGRPQMGTLPLCRPARLRIGYFSADFHRHATMHLIRGLLANHDKSRFEIHLFSYGPDRNDSERDAAVRHADHFHDVSQFSDAQIQTLAQECKLDIAVDLKGYTSRNRAHLFAKRLAPLHVSYLGYPGTMGTSAFDYIIGDPVVTPAGSERHFSEHLIRLPHSYQANDNQRKISTRQFTRADCGLPEKGFVFCCFNNSYKITPREFDTWMPLLADVEDSVLWLLASGETAEENLKREAEKRGISPERIIFADRLPLDEHLARHKVADLFLDTFNYNAHTTASDALWAGLPLLTLPGKQFAARVGASLLTAFGTPELIAKDLEDYKSIALSYAHDTEALLALHSKARTLRAVCPLFNTQLFAQHMEQAFDAIYGRLLVGDAPDHLTLIAQNCPLTDTSRVSMPQEMQATL